MKSIYYTINTSFMRKMLCLALVAVALPMAAQDDETVIDDEEVVAAPRVVEKKTNYPLKTIKGVVYDEATKKPLGGIQIKTLANNQYTAMTDDDGTFTIKVPTFATSLYVHSPEFSSQQVAIGNDSTHMVKIFMLSDKFRSMYQDGTNITANREFSAKSVHEYSVEAEMEAKLSADVRSIQRSGAPGIGNNSFIRGINSINANSQPLVVVDGVEMDLQLNRTSLHNGQFFNMLSNIMPADVESVKVLKNATALYGARGANGVIIIETKRGRSMATRIDANLSVGVNLIPKLPTMMNATQYRTYATEMLGTISGVNTNDLTFNFLNDDPNGYYYHTYHNNTDWTDEVYRTALTQNYSINVQGGDDIGMYNLSVGIVNGKSTAEGNDYSRMNVRFNTDINILKNLTTKFDITIARQQNNVQDDGALENASTAPQTSPTFLALIKSPLITPYQYNKYLGGFSYLVSDADDLFTNVDENSSLANPVAILQQAEGKNKNYLENTYFQVRLDPTLRLGRDWRITETFSYTLNRNSQRYTRPSTGVPGFQIAGLGTVYNKFSTLSANETNIMTNTRVNYSHLFGSHSVQAYAGFRFNIFSYKSDLLSTQYRSRQDDKNPHISASTTNYNTPAGDNDVWKQMQWYGNVDYNYRNRYFATLSLLGEANSRFGVNADGLDLLGVQWALFPSVQLGWVMTNEEWFPKNEGIDYLRFNVGYDISGNDNIDNYAASTVYTAVKYNGVATGLQMTNIGNDKIQWETTKKFNVGLQGNFLHNRLALAVDYFINQTSNLLTLKSFSDPISGINKYWTNGGELENTGYEVSLSGKPVVAKDWTVELGASTGHYKNKVTSLPDGDYTTSVYGSDNILTSVGNPVAVFYGYETAGVFADDAAARAAGKDGNYLYQEDASGQDRYFKSGDVYFVDRNHDGKIDASDKTIIGDPNPDIYGNIFAAISWKNLTLSANFNYSLGNDVYNYQRMVLNSGSTFYNQQVAVTNHWYYEGQHTDMPRLNYGDPMGNNRFSDRWIEDGSYLRLKTLNLAYRVPVSFTWLQGLTVWAEATNLFTVTKYLGGDPEFSVGSSVMYQGIDGGNLAQGRTFTVGLKINL